MRHPADVERLKPGRNDDRAHLDFLELLLLLEVDRLLLSTGFHAGFLAFVRQDTALEIQADFRIDQHCLGRGLRKGNVHRLALAETFVELVAELRLLIDAIGDAFLAAGAKVFVDVPGFAPDGGGVVADVAVNFHDLGITP